MAILRVRLQVCLSGSRPHQRAGTPASRRGPRASVRRRWPRARPRSRPASVRRCRSRSSTRRAPQGTWQAVASARGRGPCDASGRPKREARLIARFFPAQRTRDTPCTDTPSRPGHTPKAGIRFHTASSAPAAEGFEVAAGHAESRHLMARGMAARRGARISSVLAGRETVQADEKLVADALQAVSL